MNKTLKGFLLWTPRILGILFAAFVVLFSFDVFGTGAGFWQTLLAFLIHNIPALVLLIALVLAWRREWVGALGFLGFAIFFLFVGRGGAIADALLAGLPASIGVLFLLGWIWRKKIRG